ncbi:MAG: hypothetical protein K0R36_2044 [Chryseobacterium sp.]|jgi:hypothetical protein|uniref:hypothetical protein n=1 Tax=Chryseobacterium sp. TaxID=1871047 RepID=UPI00260B759F|nr:hypothetical protein [Chryseobacterium sp.]MDF2553840.1 hypothetical protein [Chryseobacterium sp.]MDF2932713.1 hypothetical protein [Chryseobacterium sp.]
MKKILITCSIVLSTFSFAKESSENQFVYEESSSTFSEEDTFPGNPGDPNTAPIDQYVLILLTTALALMVFVAKRKKVV